MKLGIITFWAEDNSHGYLFELNDFNEKAAFRVMRINNRSQSLYCIKYRGEGKPEKHQLVLYEIQIDKQNRPFASIKSLDFRAVALAIENDIRVTIMDFDNQLYNLEAGNILNIEPGVLSFKIHASMRREQAIFEYYDIVARFTGKEESHYWINKFIRLALSLQAPYTAQLEPVLVTIADFLRQYMGVSFQPEQLLLPVLSRLKGPFADNLKIVHGNYEMIATHFPSVLPAFVHQLQKDATVSERVLLWEQGWAPLPVIADLLPTFANLPEATRLTMLLELPPEDQIRLLVNALDKGLEVTYFYRQMVSAIRQLLSTLNISIVDIKDDGLSLLEFAFWNQGKILSAEKGNDLPRILGEFQQVANQFDCWLVGHDIETHNLPMLANQISLPAPVTIIDTLFLETLISPQLPNFALATSHQVQKEIELTLDLLVLQIMRLLILEPAQFQSTAVFLPEHFTGFVEGLRSFVKNPQQAVLTHLEKEKLFYFIQNDSHFLATQLNQFLITEVKEPAILIAPDSILPLLTGCNDMLFYDQQSDYSRLVDSEKVVALEEGTLAKFLLHNFINASVAEKQLPLYSSMPARIRLLVESTIAVESFTSPTVITDHTIPQHIAVTLDQIEGLLPFIRKSRRKIVLVESTLLSLTSKTLLATCDLDTFRQRLNEDAFWMQFTGGQSRVELAKEDLHKVSVFSYPNHLDYFWMEKTTQNQYLVWGTFSFMKLLSELTGADNILEFTYNRQERPDHHCRYAIPKLSNNSLAITRPNPETRYRDRYWAFQLYLVKQIAERENKPTVLLIDVAKEKRALYNYFRAADFYVPDPDISIARQVQLLAQYASPDKVLIITQDEIPDLIRAEALQGFCFIVDCFPLEEKWFMAKGTGLSRYSERDGVLKFENEAEGDEPENSTGDGEEDEEEAISSLSTVQDFFTLLKLQKPLIDHLRWLFFTKDKESVVWLTDSRLGDFEGLDEAWQTNKYIVNMWASTEDYEADYQVAKKHFPSSAPGELLDIDIEQAKEAIRHIFLRKKDNTVHPWRDDQHDYINTILAAEKDILVALPTGGGKSVLFQGPALYRGSLTNRLTIIVTPLKALMEDHVQKLWGQHFLGSVEYINQDRKDTQQIYRRMAGGEILLLYITPERYRSKSFVNALRMRMENDGSLEYAVYDEAHCVSQWGLDFRPDYLNSTIINNRLKQMTSRPFPLLLFSATVSEQIYNDFQTRFKNSINRLQQYTHAYNPLREHIAIGFEYCEKVEDKMVNIAKDLLGNGFDPGKSKCLIFVRRRRDAQEQMVTLENLLRQYAPHQNYQGRVAYFHGGMNGEERQEIYQGYKEDRICILLATKAFGMGMDIPNIHYIYHYGPSGTLEDYLQEVGRAGRNADMLQEAGFVDGKVINTKCFLNKDDFARIKSLLQEQRITWNNMIQVFKAVIDYIQQITGITTPTVKPVILPFNLLDRYSEFEHVRDKEQLLRLSLYWLERLERIKLGFYAPGLLEFELFNPGAKTPKLDKQQQLIDTIQKAWASRDAKVIGVDLNTFLEKVDVKNAPELIKEIIIAQHLGFFRYKNTWIINPTKKKIDELTYFQEHKDEPVFYTTVEAVYEMACLLMNQTQEGEQVNFDGDFIEGQKNIIGDDFFTSFRLPWRVTDESVGPSKADQQAIDQEQNDFKKNKAKFAFALVSFVPRVRHTTLIGDKRDATLEITHAIYNGSKTKQDWKNFLATFKANLIKVLQHVSRVYITTGKPYFNFADFMNSLGFVELGADYVEKLLIFAKWLGYLHFEGSPIPMGIELNLDSSHDIYHQEKDSVDATIHAQFHDTQKLRELRLMALESLSLIKEKEKKDRFITEYFGCDNTTAVVTLLINHLGSDHPSLKAFRDEALEHAVYGEAQENGVYKGGLNTEQRAVYEADIHSNIQVIAGPGSGKTHTLTLRVARLIHQENVPPESILVLAYNRAVVTELRERLSRLFYSLGYANIINKLKVFTFSGFCRYCLRKELANVRVSEWENTFNRIYQEKSGLVNMVLGPIRYVFVDEFQDITEARLELLKKIAPPSHTHLTVIGDPHQSIYGFERVNEGGSRDPKPYYDLFAKHYNPKVLQLIYNYRSYPDILAAASQVINLNKNEIGVSSMIPFRKTTADGYCEVINKTTAGAEWLQKLKDLLQELHPENAGQSYHQVAVMFRSNREIYRAFNIIKNSDIPRIRLRIQGESENFTRIREIAWILAYYNETPQLRVTYDLFASLAELRTETLGRFPAWDRYYFDFFECLLREFISQMDEGTKLQDLIEFVEEVSQKDDGQLSKIYFKHVAEINPADKVTEVVLTTMHKVKGLEFDAVLIPPSFTNLPLAENSDNPLGDEAFAEEVAEERRLLYVAITRARFRLVFIKWERERAVLAQQRFVLKEVLAEKMGIRIEPGFEKFYISWPATDNGDKSFALVHEELRVGTPVTLVRKNSWFVKIENTLVGCLSQKASNDITSSVKGATEVGGFVCSNIYKWTLEETIASDKAKNTNFAEKWTAFPWERGYIYIVEFSGYGMVVNP